MSDVKFGIGAIIEIKRNAFKTFPAGESVDLYLCHHAGPGAYDGLCMAVMVDGQLKEYGVARSKSYVKAMWKNYRSH